MMNNLMTPGNIMRFENAQAVKQADSTPPVIRKQPEKNAVVVELVGDRFVVHIECKDKDRESFLKDMAKDIIQHCI